MRIHDRRDIVEQVLERLRDPAGHPMTLLLGRPGSGKTTALDNLVSALADQPGLLLGYSALRAHSDFGDHTKELTPTNASEGLMAYWLTLAAAQGMPDIAAGAKTDVKVTVNVEAVHGHLDVARGWKIYLPPGPQHTVDSLVLTLMARQRKLSAGTRAPTVVAVIDGLDELKGAAPGAYNAISQLHTLADTLAAGGLRMVLSAQHKPDWFAGRVIDVEATAPAEIAEYAAAELAALAQAGEHGPRVGGVPVHDLVRAITRRAGGLFIIAAGYLAEVGAHGKVPRDIWEPGALPSAVAYFHGALARMRDPANWPGVATQSMVLDTERLLAILAASRAGLSEEQVNLIWQLDENLPAATSRRWLTGAKRNVLDGLARGYVATADGADGGVTYALLHPTLREAIVTGGHSDESISVQCERERYLRALTPLFPTGPAWSPGPAARAVLRDAPFVLADLVDWIADKNPSDPDADQWLRQCAALVESWEWMECCLLWHDPEDEVPLGLDALLAGLDRLDRMQRPLDLWPSGTEPAVPLPFHEPRPAPPRARPQPVTAGPSAAVPSAAEADEEAGEEAQERGYAFTRHHLIRPLLSGMRRFESAAEVADHFQEMRKAFKVSDKRAAGEPSGALVLWVRGYEVTNEERARGYVGNYMTLTAQRHGHYYIARIKKRFEPLSRHPLGARNMSKHRPNPDWGVHVLRNAQGNALGHKVRVYDSRGDAEADIDWLKEEYPKATSILRQGRLGVLIWDPKRSTGPRPARQFVLYVKKVDDGFVVVAESEERDRAAGEEEQP